MRGFCVGSLGCGARRQFGGKQPFGDPGARHQVADPLQNRARRTGFSPVVPGGAARTQGTQPGTDDLHAGSHLLDAADDGCEDAMIAHGVGRDDREFRAACLGIATTLPSTHALTARGRRRCNDAVLLEDGDGGCLCSGSPGLVGFVQKRGHGPVRKPQHKTASEFAHQPTACSSLTPC